LRRILLVARRDYLASVRTKAFLIGLVVAPLLFGGSAIGMALFKDKADTKEKKIAILDRTGLAAAAVIQAAREKNARDLFDKVTGIQTMPQYVFETTAVQGSDPDAERLALSGQVRRGELFAFLEIGPDALHPGKDEAARQVGYYTNAGGIDEMRRWLQDPVNEGLRKVRLSQLGVDPSHFADVLAAVPLERMSLLARDEKTGEVGAARKKSDLEGFIVPFALVLLLGMLVMVGSAPMLTAVTEDKTNRVVEMLLSVATPFELMMGKVVAAIGLSLTSSALYVLGGALTLQAMGMMGMVPFELLPWFYVYLVADVTILCAFAAALGASCSTPQEAQSLGVLLLSPVMIPFMITVPILKQPNGLLATTLSLFPPFTPLLMLLRQSMPGGVPGWQPWAGLTGIAGWTILTSFAAARIFRVAILMQGKPPKASDLLRWAIRG